MRSLRSLTALVLVGLSACAGVLRHPSPQGNNYHESVAIPGADLQFISDVTDPYWVLSGPAESYKAFPVNGPLERLLRERLQGNTLEAPSGRLRVKVHLQSLDTGMKVLGVVEATDPDRYAGSPAFGSVLTVGFGEGLLAQDLGESHNIPEEVRKWVILHGEAEVSRGTVLLIQRPFEVEQRQVVDRWDFDQWAYDYSEVMRDALDATALQVEEIVAEALRMEPGGE